MQTIKKLIPRKKQSEKETSVVEHPDLLLHGIGVSDRGKQIRVRVQNNYSKWPSKLMGFPETKGHKSKEIENNTTPGNASTLNVASSSISVNKTLSPKLKKEKTAANVTTYEEALQKLIIAQFEQNLENLDNVHKDDHQIGYKKLMKIGNKINLQKRDADFLEWKASTMIFYTWPEWRLKVLKVLSRVFRKNIVHLRENVFQNEKVEEFWKSVEHVSDIVYSEIVSKSICRLITPSLESSEMHSLLHASLMFLGEIWNYFDNRHPATLLSDATDSIVRFQMETISTKLDKELVNASKQIFSYNCPEATLQNLRTAVPILCKMLKDNKVLWKDIFHRYKIGAVLYEIVYSVWDLEISEAVITILKACKSSMVKIKFQEKYPILSQNFDTERDITLFALFQALRKFSNLTDKTALPNFVHVKANLYSWFWEFVPQWIDVACYKAMIEIDRAVQKDTLAPITRGCERSHSSTFTVMTFSNMEISWHELDWPDPKEAYISAILTLTNFDRCIQFYAERICNRIEELEDEDFCCIGGTDELYVAINSVEYVSKKVCSIAESLRISSVLQKLAILVDGQPDLERRGAHTALEQCMETPPNIIQNWKENVHRRVSSCLLLTYDKQIAPLLTMFLETAASTAENVRDSDKVIVHLDKILERMTEKLNSAEYIRAFPILADRMLDSFLGFAERHLKGTKSSPFFQLLEDMVIKICALFRKLGIGELVSKREDEISNLKESIRLYKISIQKLIIEYMKNRLEDQDSSERHCQEGFLTVIAHYKEETAMLVVTLLNASLLKAGDVNSYVRFQIYSNASTSTMKNHQNYCSKVLKHTTYPLYQETFEINIPNSEIDSSGYIHFWIKVGHFYKWNFGGEAFLPFDRISRREDDFGLVQNQLPITLPTNRSSYILNILEDRKDKTGLKFFATQRHRINSNK